MVAIRPKKTFRAYAEQRLLYIGRVEHAATDQGRIIDAFEKNWWFRWVSNNIAKHEPLNCWTGGMVTIRPKKTFRAYAEQPLLYIAPVELAATGNRSFVDSFAKKWRFCWVSNNIAEYEQSNSRTTRFLNLPIT
jgi:hypothetical protein